MHICAKYINMQGMHIYNLMSVCSWHVWIMTNQRKNKPRCKKEHGMVRGGFRAGLTEKMDICFQHRLKGNADRAIDVL